MGNGSFNWDNLNKTIRYLKRNGLYHAWYAAKERIEDGRRADYRYAEPSEQELAEQRGNAGRFTDLFSIVVPAYETNPRFLREMIDSVRRQSYGRWELIIADAGGSGSVRSTVTEIREQSGEERIRYLALPENLGIADNTNAGIKAAGGSYIALLDHDDLLAPDALYRMASALEEARKGGIEPALLYTDEDKYDDNSCCYTEPNRKENFNLDLILSNNYVCHFMAVRADLLKRLRLRGDYNGAQDYDLVLRAAADLRRDMPWREVERRIVHIPCVLYHWRCHADSTAQNTASKEYAYEAGRAALAQFCRDMGWRAEVRHSLHLGFYEITYLPDVLAVRDDVGIVGGRLLNARRRICGGAMDRNGGVLYEGLHREYSGGGTHRAALAQDVAAADIRCMRLRPQLYAVFEQITGLPYTERTVSVRTGGGRRQARIADVSGVSCDEAGYRKLSLELSRAAAARGYHILWDPRLTVTLRG